MFKKQSSQKNKPELTHTTSSQTSVTPGFASILSTFLPLLSPASALLARICMTWRRPQVRGEQQTLSVSLSLTCHQPISGSGGGWGPDPGSSSNTSRTFLQSSFNRQPFDRWGHTRAASPYLHGAKCALRQGVDYKSDETAQLKNTSQIDHFRPESHRVFPQGNEIAFCNEELGQAVMEQGT